MILTDGDESKSTTDFVGTLDPDHLGLCTAMSVKLTGGVQAGTFTGSGVVYRLDSAAGQTYVLTAKHNLHIAAKGTDKTGSALSDYFKTKVRAKVESVTGECALAAVEFPDGSSDDCKYDVCILRIDSRPLTQAVSAQLAVGMRNEFVSSGARTGGIAGDPTDRRLWDFLSTETAKKVLTHANGYKGFRLLQFGYGVSVAGRMPTYDFKKRAVSLVPASGRATPVHKWLDASHEGYQNVFAFPSKDTWTAAPGDSGGPLFAFDSTGTRSFLVGLHLGANFYDDKTDNNPSSATVNNACTVLLSDVLGVSAYDLQAKYGE